MKKEVTLGTFLVSVPSGRIVKIGNKEGNSFVICCPKEELEQALPDFEEKKLTEYHETVVRTRKFLAAFMNSSPTLASFAGKLSMDADSERSDWSMDGFIKECNSWLQRSYDLRRKLDRSIERENNFKPYAERLVLDSYEATVEDALIIIVEGQDAGQFWTYEEAQNGIQKEDSEETNEQESEAEE